MLKDTQICMNKAKSYILDSSEFTDGQIKALNGMFTYLECAIENEVKALWNHLENVADAAGV